MTIAVDFDGTIVEHRYPNIGKERPFAFDVLKKLQKEGHKLILWTAREGRLRSAVSEQNPFVRADLLRHGSVCAADAEPA